MIGKNLKSQECESFLRKNVPKMVFQQPARAYFDHFQSYPASAKCFSRSLWGECFDAVCDGVVEIANGASCCFFEEGLEFRDGHLDGVEVGRTGRQEAQFSAGQRRSAPVSAGLLVVAAVEIMMREAHVSEQDGTSSVLALFGDFVVFTFISTGLGGGS